MNCFNPATNFFMLLAIYVILLVILKKLSIVEKALYIYINFQTKVYEEKNKVDKNNGK